MTTPTIKISDAERDLIAAMRAIVLEVADESTVQPYSFDSYLPQHLVDSAQAALSMYGAQIVPTVQGVAV